MQERFQALTAAYYRGAVAALVVYDITKRETFEHVGKWVAQLRELEPDVDITLVGNKADLRHLRDVTVDEAAAYAKLNDMDFIETSCQSGSNVQQAFESTITRMSTLTPSP